MLNVEQLELSRFLDGEAPDPAEVRREMYRRRETGMQFSALEESRLLLKQNLLDETLALLEHDLPKALTSPSLDTVRMVIVQSMAYFLKHEETQALSSLQQALTLAEPEKLVASFVREGAVMERLLRLALAKSMAPGFVRRLLQAFEARRKPGSIPAIEPLIEPLSGRELEILQTLNGPLSTPEIAEQLVVSANTVRTHIKNIYGKLGVHGRSGAVRRAKELGLLH